MVDGKRFGVRILAGFFRKMALLIANDKMIVCSFHLTAWAVKVDFSFFKVAGRERPAVWDCSDNENHTK